MNAKETAIVMLCTAGLAIAATVNAAEPAYWMKSYPNAPQAKVAKCLAVAEEAYEKNLKGNMEGVMWAVLWKGNAWEKCMES